MNSKTSKNGSEAPKNMMKNTPQKSQQNSLYIYETIWDVIVIGGGPAGMMTAGRAAERGLCVLLIEKNDSLGKKLLITGGGRCNVTNAELDTRKLLSKFKGSDKFLFSAFSQYSVQDALDFFHKRNMPTKVENEKRVFPVSNKSSSVLEVLVNYINEGKVTVLSNTEVAGFIIADGENDGIQKTDGVRKISGVKIKGGRGNSDKKDGISDGKQSHSAEKSNSQNIIKGKSIVLATGGKSHPETGSTGDGFVWLKEIGHKVIEPVASLVPIAIKDAWLTPLSGTSIANVKINILQNGVKQATSVGKILFTHFGISGPTVLNMSKEVSELLKYGDVHISLDILPQKSHAFLNAGLNELFRKESNKKLKNCLKLLNEMVSSGTGATEVANSGPSAGGAKEVDSRAKTNTTLPSAIFNTIIHLANVDPEKFAHSVTREERLRIIDVIKNMNMEVKGLLGEDKAIVTSGGIDLTEVDFKTMGSRLFPNLYLVGDILNIDRPSGGYSLQLCWTTGFVAGSAV